MRLSRRQALAAGVAFAATPVHALAPDEKLFVLAARREGLEHDAFIAAWRGRLEAAGEGVVGVVLHDVISTTRRPDIPAGEDVPLDAIAEIWRRPGARLPYDADIVGGRAVLMVRENVAVPAARGDICLFALLRRPEAKTHEAFVHHWVDGHGAMARNVPRVRGLLLNEVVAPKPDSALAVAIGDLDGVAQSYRDDPTRPLDSPQAREWYADGAASIGHARTYRTREHILRAPPGMTLFKS